MINLSPDSFVMKHYCKFYNINQRDLEQETNFCSLFYKLIGFLIFYLPYIILIRKQEYVISKLDSSFSEGNIYAKIFVISFIDYFIFCIVLSWSIFFHKFENSFLEFSVYLGVAINVISIWLTILTYIFRSKTSMLEKIVDKICNRIVIFYEKNCPKINWKKDEN
jgi:hypothetical protein